MVKSPLLLTEVSDPPQDNEDICFDCIRQWIECLPSIRQIYLAHGYDDNLNIGGFDYLGFSDLYFKNREGVWLSGTWRQQTHRFCRYLNKCKATKKEDRAGYDSEVYDTKDSDQWNV